MEMILVMLNHKKKMDSDGGCGVAGGKRERGEKRDEDDEEKWWVRVRVRVRVISCIFKEIAIWSSLVIIFIS